MSEHHPHGEVRTETLGHVLHITVDRSEKRNGFTPKMVGELREAMTRLDESVDLWVGVLSFAGDHTTAGLDMPLFFGEEAEPIGGRSVDAVDHVGLGRRCRKPLVMAVQGITFTLGIEIMLGCDIVVAADDCRFSQLEAKRGLAPLGGATIRFVERAGWGNAMYHLLRVDEFDAEEAYRIGFVQEVVPAGTQVQRALEIAEEIASDAPLAIQATKANSLLYVREGEQAAIDAIPAMGQELTATEDFAEGIASFIDRRAATFKGR